MDSSSLRRAFLLALVASLLASGGLGIAALLARTFGTLQAKVLLTSLTVSAASILALAAGVALEKGRVVGLARAAIAATLVAAAMFITLFWLDPGGDYVQWTLSAGVVAITLTHCSLLTLARIAPPAAWVRTAALVASLALGAMLVATIWVEPEGDTMFRWNGVLSICVTVTTVLVPLLHKIRGLSTSPPALPAKVCPTALLDGADLWSPIVLARLAGGFVVRAARIHGRMGRHVHRGEDEFFFVLDGRMRLRLDDGEVDLDAGEGILVPAGVFHAPESDEGARILLFEPGSTRARGDRPCA